MNELKTDVLIVGGGTGGTAAAIQAARRGAKTILVSESAWLGGMLTTAGVTAPDGNELVAFQTGIWGAFLRELRSRQPQGLDHGWVSFFTYEPGVGAEIFADWVRALPNLHWIADQTVLEVEKRGDRIEAVRFPDFRIEAHVVVDGTELGDVLALADVPHRWGWEWRSVWDEPSAPEAANAMTKQYPVQAPTWVVVLQDFGVGATAPAIAAPSRSEGIDEGEWFRGAWKGYGIDRFLNYGRLPGDRFMMNWPQQGNDYGVGLGRLIASESARQEFWQEAYDHSQSFARFVQQEVGGRIGLAANVFPEFQPTNFQKTNPQKTNLGGGSFALHPYYRESRRLQGLVTVTEHDILPTGQVAKLPVDPQGRCAAIAIGNYANDHHYPGYDFPLAPKSLRWGGRWTGTPFALPYGCLVPATTDGLLVCEKNISVSHIANGATRLQPLVLGIGQAAGMAAALCVEQHCQPRELAAMAVQRALLEDAIAPAAVVPLFNVPPGEPDWQQWQRYYLEHPEQYPPDGYCPIASLERSSSSAKAGQLFQGIFQHRGQQDYGLILPDHPQSFNLVTLHPEMDDGLQRCVDGQALKVWGRWNPAGNWLLVEHLE
jgi:hypothetical protein